MTTREEHVFDSPGRSAEQSSQPAPGHGRIRALIQEDGLIAFLQRACVLPFRRVRDRDLAKRLHAPGLHLGMSPKLRGLRHIRLGKNFSGGDFLWIEAVTQYRGQTFEPRISIGNDVVMSSHIHLGATGEIVIEDGVMIGSRVTIIDHNHGVYAGVAQSNPEEPPAARPLSPGRPVHIDKNVWIGDGAVILPGAHIGAGSIIGANSVVSGAIPDNCIAVGTPARAVRRFSHDTKEWSAWEPKL